MKKPDVSRKYGVMSLGEILLRLSPEGNERIAYSELFEKRIGGSELNVAAGVCMLGIPSAMISALPENEIGKYASRALRYAGVGGEYVLSDSSANSRLGIYYAEHGAAPRQTAVVYDRANTSFDSFSADRVPSCAFREASVFHTGGITLAKTPSTRATAKALMLKFKEAGALISFDVNYRSSLWSEQEARAALYGILPLVDILFVSDETLRRMLCKRGTLEDIQLSLSNDFPNLSLIASTERQVVSPRLHHFSSTIYDAESGTHHKEPPYRNIEVIDRIGSGDAFVAGALYALLKFGSPYEAVRYGNAMAALKNTTLGDMPECDLSDVLRTVKNHAEANPDEMIR